MKLNFFGSGAFGLPTFQALAAAHEIVGVVSQPDRPAGRKRVMTPTPVAAWAQAQGMPVRKLEAVNTPEFVAEVAGWQADASVVIAFGQKLSPELVEAMGRLSINLHASLLPSWRGAAPINRSMMAGDAVTGVSVIGIAERMDAGDVYAMSELAIDPDETAGELHDRLAELGPDAIGRVLDDLAQDRLNPQVQDHERATLAKKLSKAQGTVAFDQPAEAVRAQVHGLTPWPGCTVRWRDADGQERPLMLRRVASASTPTQAEPGTVLDGLLVATSSGVIRLVELQAPGTKLMPAEAFAQGHGLQAGHMLQSNAEN